MLDAAIRASSGGNTQHWTFIVVRDADKRRQIAAIYRKASDYRARSTPHGPSPSI